MQLCSERDEVCHRRRSKERGIVEQFLDHNGGICYDCDGTGRIKHVAGASRRRIIPKQGDLSVGLRVRALTKGAPVETVTSLHRDPDFGWSMIVTTDAGNEYPVDDLYPTQIRLA